ncbi:TPA: porin family protein [Escherichia coli]|nr:porin family protein [Escherichia coli]
MKKVFAVSVVAAACVFAANAGAEEGKSGFYLTGKAGASVVSLSDQRFLSGDEEETSKYKGGDDHDTVFSGGIAAGYDFYPQFSIPVRTELEFYARGKADSKYNVDKDSWSGGYWRDDLKNEVSVNTLMLNAYYDFRNSSAFTPWISAGLGYARVHHKTSYIYTDNSPAGSEVYSASASKYENNLAWSLGAGVRYDVTPDIALDLSYRYIDAGDSSVSYKDEWGDKYKSEVDVKSHDIMLGVTYNF